MIRLYTFGTPNGHKASIALEELDFTYETVAMDLAGQANLMPEYLAISPIGKVPALIDHGPPGGGGRRRVFGSGAILYYLAKKSGALIPEDPAQQAEMHSWLALDISDLGPTGGRPFPLCGARTRAAALRGRPVQARDPPLLRRAGGSTRTDDLCGRSGVHDRGHLGLPVRGGRGGGVRDVLRDLSQPQALARRGGGPTGGALGNEPPAAPA